MVILWSELALIQAWLLPGWAVTSSRRELRLFDRLLLAAPLSAVLNALLIELLTLAHAYTRAGLVAVACVEIAVIAWNETRAHSEVRRIETEPIAFKGPWDGIVVLLVAYVCAYALRIAVDESRSIYQAWDAILVWNPWAKQWASGHFPARTWHYPQVLPAAMSLAYVAVQDPRLEQLSKWATVVIPLLGLATGLRVATFFPSLRTTLALAVLFAAWRLYSIVGADQAFGGMADVPVAYMVLATGYALLLAWRAGDEHRRGLLVLAGLICAGALLTKLTAMFEAGIVLAWMEFRRRQGRSLGAVLRELAIPVTVVALVAGHWYVFKEILIRTGRDASEIGYVTSIVQLPWHEKLVRGWGMIWGNSRRLMLPAALLSLLSLTSVFGRWVFLAGTLPAFVGWSFLLSYDARNFAVGVLPLSGSALLGANTLVRMARRLMPAADALRIRFRPHVFAAGLVLLAIGSVAVGRRYSRERLLVSALDQRRYLGDPAVNEMLFQLLPTLRAGERIGTSYQALQFLPGFEDRYRLIHCGSAQGTAEALRQQPSTYFLLRRNDCDSSLTPAFNAASTRGVVRQLGEAKGQVLYEILRPDPLIAALDSAAATRRNP